MNKNINNLLQHPHIWRLNDLANKRQLGITTGFSALDKELPDNGWPEEGVTELLCDNEGIGEISLLLPTFAKLNKEGKVIALIAPRYYLFPLALKKAGVYLSQLFIVEAKNDDLLWATEEVLKSGCCGMVVLFGQKMKLDYTKLRRLHLAATNSNTLCMLYRLSSVKNNPSAAPLRILLSASQGLLNLNLIKRRGSVASLTIKLAMHSSYWQESKNEHSSVSNVCMPIVLKTANPDF